MGKRFKKMEILDYYKSNKIHTMKFTKLIKTVIIPELNKIANKYEDERQKMVLRLNLIISKNLLDCSDKGLKELGKKILLFIPLLKSKTDFAQLMKSLDIMVGFTSKIISGEINDSNIDTVVTQLLGLGGHNGSEENVVGGNKIKS